MTRQRKRPPALALDSHERFRIHMDEKDVFGVPDGIHEPFELVRAMMQSYEVRDARHGCCV